VGDVLVEVLAAAERQNATATVRLIAEGRSLFDRALDTFTNGEDLRWWWTRLPDSTVFHSFPEDDGFRHLLRVVPDPDEPVLFVVEDDDEPFFPFLEATPKSAQAIIGDSFAFEYYLIHPSFSWLVGENHHSALFACGSPVAEQLAEIAST
jgi:hypothetical protein